MNDQELRDLLTQWKAPEQAPRHIEDRIFGDRGSWFRWLFAGSVRVPVPVLAASIILVGTAAFLWTRKQADPPPAVFQGPMR